MADQGLQDAQFYAVPEDVQACTLDVFKVVWRHFGVSRVQVCRIDSQDRVMNQTVLAYTFKPHMQCEGYYDVMQGLYRVITLKLQQYDNLVYRIWIIFAWYILYTTQCPPLGAKKVGIEQPIYYWPVLSQLLADLNTRRGNSDAFACLQYLLSNNVFIYTLDFNIHMLNGHEQMSDCDILALNPFFLQAAETCKGDSITVAGMYDVNVRQLEAVMQQLEQTNIPGAKGIRMNVYEFESLNKSYPSYDTYSVEYTGVQVPLCTVDLDTQTILPSSFLNLLLEDPATQYAHPILLHPQSVGVDVDYTYLSADAVDIHVSSYTGMSRNKISEQVVTQCKQSGLLDSFSMYYHALSTGQIPRMVMNGPREHRQTGLISLNDVEVPFTHMDRHYDAPKHVQRDPYTMSCDASALIQPVVMVPVSVDSLLPNIDFLQRRLGVRIDGKVLEQRKASRNYIGYFMSLCSVFIEPKSKQWLVSEALEDEMTDREVLTSESLEAQFGKTALSEVQVIKSLQAMSKGAYPSILGSSLSRILRFVQAHSKDYPRVKAHLLETWQANLDIGGLATEVEGILDNLKQILEDKKVTTSVSNRVLHAVCRNSRLCGNGFDLQVLKLFKKYREKKRQFREAERERKAKGRARAAEKQMQEIHVEDSIMQEQGQLGSIPSLPIQDISPGFSLSGGISSGIPPIPGLSMNK